MNMDDRSSRPGTRRALVSQRQGRALEKQVPLGRFPNEDRYYSGEPWPAEPASRRSMRFGRRVATYAGVFLLAAIGLLYARLFVSPVSLTFLVPALQKQINSQLQGYSFHARDAILQLANGWRVEFRLAGVRLVDDSNQELAKAPFAAIGISGMSLFKFSPAASRISLLGPKLLVFNTPGKGLTLTAPPAAAGASGPAGAESGDSWEPDAEAPYADLAAKERMRAAAASLQGGSQQPLVERLNPAPVLARLFKALKLRGGASSALQQIGVKDAEVYFASEKGVVTWRIADFHIDLEEGGSESALRGQLMITHEDTAWHASFRAVNRLKSGSYSLTASVQDIVPHAIWKSVPVYDALKLADLPVSGEARFDIGHDGTLLGGEGEIKLGAGKFFAPFDQKHPAVIDGGLLKVSYDKAGKVFSIKPFELRWDDSLLTLSGTAAYSKDAATNQPAVLVNLDGTGTVLGAPQFGVAPVPLDIFKVSLSYEGAGDSVTLKELTLAGAGGAIALNGQASGLESGGPIRVNGILSPMPISLLKVIWPPFAAHGAREWVGTRVPKGRLTSGNIAVNVTGAMLAALEEGGDIPDKAVKIKAGFSGLEIYHVKGLPPINAKEGVLRFAGRHYYFDIPGEGRVVLPSGRSLSVMDGQFIIEDLRPDPQQGEIRFKAKGDVGAVLELLDQPALGYVKSTGFEADLVTGQVSGGFKIGLPMIAEPKLAQMSLAGKVHVTQLKSGGLPGGLSVNGGTVDFDVSEAAISAKGDLKVNNVPVVLAWQRIYDAPPEQQPTLRLAGVLNEKARDRLGLNVNHILKGDLPIALAVSMGADGPPRLFVEANLTNTDVFLTAIGWRKPPGQKASLTFDLIQRPDDDLMLDNFALTGDGLNINGHVLLNGKRRIAGFNFPVFSTNALTKLAISGELTPKNVLKVQAKGPSFDGRQFFRSLFKGGRISESQPAPLKDQPGLDLSVEIETVFGYYDATLKSVVVEAKRRNGKLTYLEAAGRLNGAAPLIVHVEKKKGQPRMLTSDATDAGSVLRLTGAWGSARGGTMNLKVNLDGGRGYEKSGVIDVRRLEIVNDEVVGRVVSQAEQERARVKPNAGNGGQQAYGERMVFDRMVVPFAITSRELQIRDAAVQGTGFGVTGHGRVDFSRELVAFSGTYVPFYGVNNLLGGVPIIGDILTGPGGKEGIFAMTFAIKGRTSNPEVIVNPASMFAPGLLRQIFEFDNRRQTVQ